MDIELTEEIAEGIYSNFAIITHSQTEFIVDFVRMMPGIPKGKVKSRIILAPQHAKRLVMALSDSYFYPAPMTFQLADFEHIQASVFQVARAPGQTIVYLGCVLLIVGVFAMLYVRERRLWIWLSPAAGGSSASMALSTNRKTLDADKEFGLLKSQLLKVQS